MKSLSDKLGYKPDVPALVWRAPASLATRLSTLAPDEEPRFFLAFVRDRVALAEAMTAVVPFYQRGGHLWLAYPKKSGAMRSDLNRDSGWDELAGAGLRPVTQIAIDADWSALRFRFADEIK